MTKNSTFLALIILLANGALANSETPIVKFAGTFNYAEVPVHFKTYNSFLRYLSIKTLKGIDSANAFYRLGFQNPDKNYTDYLPLTAGSSFPLTGTLLGIDANFTSSLPRVLTIQSSQSGGGDFLAWFRSSNTAAGQSYGLLIDAGTNSSDNAFRIRSAGAGAEFFAVLGNGNIGVGTATPSDKLTVNGNISIHGNDNGLNIYKADATTAVVSLGPYNGLNTDEGVMYLLKGNVNKVFLSANRDSYFNGGNVGIGTTTPVEKLSVNGTILAKKMRVSQLVWSDYVFNSDYKLRTLSSLEAFIKQNKHLPEVPSAKEVEEKGINVGDNQALLLKKIEELTLYLIQQDKKIDLVIAENKKLKRLIKNNK